MNEQISLYFSQGNSNKEYHVQLTAQGNNFVVNFQYGRRGSALKAGTKTATPIAYAAAKEIYDELVKEKMCKGYSTGESGAAYQGGTLEAQFTGILPQLLNTIDEATLEKLLNDDRYGMQEKYDGHRRLIACQEQVVGINKKGLQVAIPVSLADALSTLPAQSVADGEQIGEKLVIFDLLQLGDEDLRHLEYLDRYTKLAEVIANMQGVQLAPLYLTQADKRAAFDRIKACRGEGVVFKLLDAPYQAGRPSSGGSQLKYKFTESATLEVAAQTKGKRSVAVVGYTPGNQAVKLGNVTIPANYEIPPVGAIVEVEYLYAYEGGSLYQPVYRGLREDQDLADCTVAQLKFKPNSAELDDDGEG